MDYGLHDRYDFDEGSGPDEWTLETSEDAYTGVNPVFIFDDATPNTVTIIWGNTKAFDEYISQELTSPTKAQSADIVLNTDMQITAVSYYETPVNYAARFEIYTLFPIMGMGYYTYHKNTTMGGRLATTATHYFACEFAY